MDKHKKEGRSTERPSFVLDGQHGEIVALLGVADKGADGPAHAGDEVCGSVGGRMLAGHVDDAVQSEQFVVDVLGLVQSVGVEEYGGLWCDGHLLLRELPAGHDAEWQVGVDGQLTDGVGNHQRRVVAGVAVVQQTVVQIEHADKGGDEHVGLVAFGQRVVEGYHNMVGLGGVSRDVAEERPCDSHDQRGRHTLARDVADAEEELLVADVEVEEVAAHILGRCQRTVDVDVVALGVGWERLGEHGHLYVVGHPQLVLDGGLRGRRGLQVVDVLGERALHVLERVAQQPYLVVVLDAGQGNVEVTLGHHVGRLCQPAQRTGGPLDDDTSHDARHQQTDGNEHQHDGAQEYARPVEHQSWYGKGYRPVGLFYGFIEHVDVEGLAVEELEVGGVVFLVQDGARVPGYHLPAGVVVKGVGRLLGAFKVVVADDAAAVGMGNERAVAVDDEVEGEESPSAVFPLDSIVVGTVVDVRVSVDVDFHVASVVANASDGIRAEPRQRQVGTENGHRPACMVVDGNQPGYKGDGVGGVEERLRPIAAVALQCLGEPFGLQVVVVLVADVALHHLSAIAADGVGTVPTALLGIVVGHEADAAAADVRRLAHDALHDVVHLVGVVKVLLYLGHAVDGAYGDVRQHASDVLVSYLQIALVEVDFLALYETDGQLINKIGG